MATVTASKIDDKQEIGIGGFTAFAKIREVETRIAESPDVPLEDGSIANDHIINKPVSIEMEGRVSEVFIKDESGAGIYRAVIKTVGVITSYLPERTATQVSKITSILNDIDAAKRLVSSIVKTGQQAFDFFGNKTDRINHQEKFIEMLDSYYDNKALMQIETGGRVLDNMVILSRVITRDNKNGLAIDFKISAKQLVFSEVISTDIQQYFTGPAEGEATEQVAGQVDNGLNDAPEVDVSVLASGRDFLARFVP